MRDLRVNLRAVVGFSLFVPGQVLRLLQQGAACTDGCPGELECICLALNRGLKICEPPGFLWVSDAVAALERRGLGCAPRLPHGARPMAAPPALPAGTVDPRQRPELAAWAEDVGGFYSQYSFLHGELQPHVGVALLAGPDVTSDYFEEAASTLRHILVEAMPIETLRSLSAVGVRFLIAGAKDEDWLRHPEVSREFTTGLGGGAPWFPSTGVHQGESQVTIIEELLHTIQYCSLKPRDVCMYHKAYKQAMEEDPPLYTTDGSGEEIDGEPVPTVQADEYMAMAMHRWFGSGDGLGEYRVHGNTEESTGREKLRQKDPKAFCLLSQIFRADDAWNPQSDHEPWKSFRNQAMDVEEVKKFCKPVLEDLSSGCPLSTVSWPDGPRRIP